MNIVHDMIVCFFILKFRQFMKIYTKTGDTGETSLLSGARVLKNNERLEAYGTIDELNSYIGLLRSYDMSREVNDFLLVIQNKLFSIGSLLSKDKDMPFEIPEISEQDVSDIESHIDRMNNFLAPLNRFIIPGGNRETSICHVARTVCRRAERNVVSIMIPGNNIALIIKYLNRLSDYLFVLARKILKDSGCQEVYWEDIR
jgi:cob(I)alamin adenosyltransferase